MTRLRIAAFQRQPLFDDVPGTLARLLADLAQGDAAGIDVAIFPEGFLQGYEGYDCDRSLLERRAMPLAEDGPFGAVLEALAAIRTTIVLGMIERRGERLFNTAVVIQAGRLLGITSKQHPHEAAFAPGQPAPVFDIAGWPFGINICNDANFPATAQKLRQQGARLICYPLNNMLEPERAAQCRELAQTNLQQRASETGCWVASSDVVGRHGSQISYGCTAIVDPHGKLVARAPEETEGRVQWDLA
jgi:predicted amidohydrolase